MILPLTLLSLITAAAWMRRLNTNRKRRRPIFVLGRSSPAARALMIRCNPALHISPTQTQSTRS